MLILLCVYLCSGILLSLLSIPLLAEKIKPNMFYGFRIKATLENPNLWYAVNKYFARWQLFVGLVVVIVSVGFYFWPGISIDIYALACLAIFVLSFGAAIVKSVLYINKLRKSA